MKDNIKKFFYKKKVLITGNTGFKGSWLSLWMHYYKAKVLGLSLDASTKPSNFSTLNLKKRILFKKTDIRNFKDLKKKIINFKPDYIFHLAAEAIVNNSHKNPFSAWQTNTLGTINILEILRSIKKNTVVIMITSDKVYKNFEQNKGYKETDIIGGLDTYSASKASADLAIQSYINSFFKNKKKNIKISIARAGNVIGGGDWSNGRIIPDCVKKWSKNKIAIIKNPRSTRPWQHILDVLFGYIILAVKLKLNSKLSGEIFNFGPNTQNKQEVIGLVKEFVKNWQGKKWLIVKKKNLIESKLLQLNSFKAKKLLQWNCILNLKKTINLTAEWYKKFYSKEKDMFEFSIQQIKDYEKLLKDK